MVRSLVLLAGAFGLALGAAVPAIAQSAAPQIGAEYPGSRITELPPKDNACGKRYRFAVRASVGQVADFYLAQGHSSRLALVKDTGGTIPGFRIISFQENGPGRLLFVTMNSQDSETSGEVYYVLARKPGCH